MKTFKVFLAFILSALILSGCAVRTAPGQTKLIKKEFDFYFSSGEDQYRNISEDLYDLFISDVKWYASDGITLQDPILQVSPIVVKWQEGDIEYKVPGVKISIQVTAILDEDISIGKKGIYIGLPNIQMIANAMGVQPKTGEYPLDEEILVSQVNVHSSRFVSLAIVYIPIGLVTITLLVFGWEWLKYRL